MIDTHIKHSVHPTGIRAVRPQKGLMAQIKIKITMVLDFNVFKVADFEFNVIFYVR